MLKVTKDKKRYADILSAHYLPIQFQTWWLDAVCPPGEWDVLILEKGSRLLGVFTYFIRKKWYGIVLDMPPFTSYMGFFPIEAKSHQDIRRVMRAVASHVTEVVQYHQGQHYHAPPYDPELLKHWQASEYYTCIFGHKMLKERAYNRNVRRTVSEHSKADITEGDDAAFVFGLQQNSLKAKGIGDASHEACLRRLDGVLQQREARKIWLFHVPEYGVVAGVYAVFDKRSCTILLSGMDRNTAPSGALIVLYDRVLTYAEKLGLEVDFDGGMEAGSAHIFESLGAKAVPYTYLVRKPQSLLSKLFFIRHIVRPSKYAVS